VYGMNTNRVLLKTASQKLLRTIDIYDIAGDKWSVFYGFTALILV